MMEALRELRKMSEDLDIDVSKGVDTSKEDKTPIEIIKFPADEYCVKAGCEPGDYDWEDGRKAKFIYTDEAEESAQVGIEFEDGTFAVVGLNNDHLCDTYAEMVECIARYL